MDKQKVTLLLKYCNDQQCNYMYITIVTKLWQFISYIKNYLNTVDIPDAKRERLEQVHVQVCPWQKYYFVGYLNRGRGYIAVSLLLIPRSKTRDLKMR